MGMMKRSKAAAWLLAGAFMLGSAFPAWAAEAPVSSNVKTDAQIVEALGVLQGMEVVSALVIWPRLRQDYSLLFYS